MLAVLVGLIVPAQASAQAPTTVPFGRDVPMTGQTKGGQKFTGNFHIDEFAERNGQIVAIGDLKGKLANKGKGKGARKVTRYNVAVPVSGLPSTPAAGTARSAQACNVLNLVLGPLDLRLLGLRVQLNQVKLDITAIPGGGLLGDLLCGLAGGPGPLSSVVAALNGLLSGILGILNLGSALPVPAVP
jgi:hypothetical protein